MVRRSAKPMSTVTTYMAIPSRASKPIWLVSRAINPKTANGAKSMAQRTTVMQTCCSDVRRSSRGLDCVGVKETSATPTITAKITT